MKLILILVWYYCQHIYKSNDEYSGYTVEATVQQLPEGFSKIGGSGSESKN
ncbi:MAG TPA: hypothetical protein VIK74_09590 [Parasegetibacter sp.]|jgi:hypothetical protein